MAPQAEKLSCEHICHPLCQKTDHDQGSEHVNPPATTGNPNKPAASGARLLRTSGSTPRAAHLVKRSPAALRREKSNTVLVRSRNRGKESAHMSRAKPLPSLPEDLGSPTLPVQAMDRALVSTLAQAPIQTSDEEFLKYSPSDLVKLITQLRIENEALKNTNTPPRSSSLSSKLPSHMISVPREEWDMLCSQSSTIDNEAVRLREELSEISKDCTEQKARALHAEARAAEAEKQAKRTMKELALATRTETSSFDDKHFEDEVKKLRCDVSNWARNQEWKIANDKDTFQDNVARYDFLKTTCPSFTHYIVDSPYITDLVEAHLWQFFVRKVFGNYVWTVEQRSVRSGQEKRTHNPHRQWRDFIGKPLLAMLPILLIPIYLLTSHQKITLKAASPYSC